MNGEWFARSAGMLRAVLGGATYEVVAQQNGLTRTAVERRVKGLVRQLVRSVGVDGLNESRIVFVRSLRAHREDIESALARFEPVSRQTKATGSIVLSDEDIRRAMVRVRARTSTPERDLALVWILLATGLRPLEVARLRVGDYLNADGSVRLQSEVRADVAVNGRARALYFTSTAACEAVDLYLAKRLATESRPGVLGGSGDRPYRGLEGRDPLFLNQAGRAFHVEATPTAHGMRSLCREIHYEYRKIFRRVDIPGLTALGVRHTIVDRLLRRGAEQSAIGDLLGVRELKPPRRERVPMSELMQRLV